MGLFAPKISPQDQVKKWKADLKSEERKIQRQIVKIEREEKKVTQSIKTMAKKDPGSAKILAKEVVQSRRARERLMTSKAQLNSVGMQLQQTYSMAKVMGSMQKSTEVMACMQNLVRLPAISMTMQAMSKEMAKAGLIEEMMNDMTEMEDDSLEDEAEDEVNRVMDELTAGTLAQAGAVSDRALPTKEQEGAEVDDMMARLEALK
eukprot:TRINITY_DN28745_c0_g1_i1.p1 TRINITY_DN28745_c0_g1~~TRINITY_DN28745_c0_g1_i1.p1  ORF type:complete len:205 (-),score=62.40 TRINITY_DN28745_c0_g1_i1:32-646(-)